MEGETCWVCLDDLPLDLAANRSNKEWYYNSSVQCKCVICKTCLVNCLVQRYNEYEEQSDPWYAEMNMMSWATMCPLFVCNAGHGNCSHDWRSLTDNTPIGPMYVWVGWNGMEWVWVTGASRPGALIRRGVYRGGTYWLAKTMLKIDVNRKNWERESEYVSFFPFYVSNHLEIYCCCYLLFSAFRFSLAWTKGKSCSPMLI